MSSCIKKTKNEDEYNKKEKSTLNEKPLNIQLISKLSFQRGDIDINNKRYAIEIRSVHELPNNRIGILTEFYLLIHSLNTMKLIKKLEPDLKLILLEDKDIGYSPLYDFTVLKNNDLVIWNSIIIFFYKLNCKEYKLYQTINEYNLGTDKEKYFKYNHIFWYKIKSIYELSNGNLVSCNNLGLKLYYKKNNKYYLKSELKSSKDVEKVVEIKPNILILFTKTFVSGGCRVDVFSNSISIYDIENKKKTYLKTYDNLRNHEGDINFLIKNNYLLIRYNNALDIFNIENMELITFKNEKDYYIYDYFNGKELKTDMRINFLCDYYDDLFFVKDYFWEVKIYKFEDEKISFFSNFPFEIIRIKGMFKLKNKNNFIVMYSQDEIQVLHYKNY